MSETLFFLASQSNRFLGVEIETDATKPTTAIDSLKQVIDKLDPNHSSLQFATLMTTVAEIMAKAQKDVARVMEKAHKDIAKLEGTPVKEPKATTSKAKASPKSKATSKADKSETAKPKRPLNAYMLFANANRDAVKKSLGGQPTIGEIGKELGRQWNLIKETTKAKKYHDAAAKQKAEMAK